MTAYRIVKKIRKTTANSIAYTPRWERSEAKVRVAFMAFCEVPRKQEKQPLTCRRCLWKS